MNQDVGVVKSNDFIILTSSLLAALLCYDHLLTFDREVRYIWPRGLCVSSILYFAIRYPALVYVSLLLYFVGPWQGKTLQVCKVIGKAGIAGFIIVLTAAAIFSGLRAYALCGRRLPVLIIVALLALVNPVTLVIELSGTTDWQIAPFGVCIFQPTISAQVYENGQVAARTCTIVADLSVLSITWSRTFPEKVGGARVMLRSGIATCMLKDGTIYFGVLLIVHIVSLALIRKLEYINVMSQLIHAFTTLLACRFILDLHEAAEYQFGGGSHHSPSLASSSIAFHPRGRAPDGASEPHTSVFGVTMTQDSPWVASGGLDDIELHELDVASSGSRIVHNAVDDA